MIVGGIKRDSQNDTCYYTYKPVEVLISQLLNSAQAPGLSRLYSNLIQPPTLPPYANLVSLVERVQKAAIRLILGERYENYEDGLLRANLESLKERREKLCKTLAIKYMKSENPRINTGFPKKKYPLHKIFFAKSHGQRF